MQTDPGPPGEWPPGRGAEPPDPGRATEAGGQLGGEQRPAAPEPARMTQDSIVDETQQSQETAASDAANDPAVADSSVTPAEQDESTRRGGEDQAAPEVAQASAEDHDRNQQPTIPEIGSAELFQAVVQAVRDGGQGAPREAWLKTVAQLFEYAHATVTIDEEGVPASKQRYPKLKGDERALLFNWLKEFSSSPGGTYVEWERGVANVIQDLYNTKWSLKHLLQSKISQVKWARVKPLNQWVAKIKTGQSAGGRRAVNQEEGAQYEPFMFNPAFFKPDDIVALRAICENEAENRPGRRLRVGTDDEWRIIGAMAEGTMVCRKTPDFVRSVLDGQERQRLYRTIQVQVEGELVVQLRSWAAVKANRQQPRLLREDILMAATAVGNRVNLNEIQAMLNLAKTLSYNYVQRSIHVYFFDRTTAKRFQDTPIPFKGIVYRPTNAHRYDTGSGWTSRRGRDGSRLAEDKEYVIDLFNIARVTDVGRLTAYFRKHLDVGFELEDRDANIPNSPETVFWQLTIKSAECPEFLRGIVRLLWFGRSLVLQHPYAKHRLQCYRCGTLGHTMTRCSYTAEQLEGSGGRVVKDKELVGLPDQALTFDSYGDIKGTADKRWELHVAAVTQEREAVQPTSEKSMSDGEPPKGPASVVQVDPTIPNGGLLGEAEVKPKPKPKWIAQPMNHGRTLYGHAEAFRDKGITTSSRFAALAEDEEGDGDEAKTEEKPPAQVIDLASAASEDKPAQQPSAAGPPADLHLVTAKPPKLQEQPKLVALKQRERDILTKEKAKVANLHGHLLQSADIPVEEMLGFPEIEQGLGLRPVTTPASGNCMAMALAQACADHDLAAHDDVLENMTAALKRGILWAGQLNFNEQFDHFTRTTTLVNVNRGWTNMTAPESLKQFKWYLTEYASTESHRKATVSRHNWGSSELMAIAANFLQTKIYVLAYDTDNKKQWYCSKYRPGSRSKGRKVFETGQQVPLQLTRCLEAIRADKRANQTPPLVIRYWGEHFSRHMCIPRRPVKTQQRRSWKRKNDHHHL